MTRRKLVMGQRSQDGGNNYAKWELPTHWTAAQALAVFEVRDDLRDLVVDGYAKKIQQAARLDRTVTTSSPPANIDDGDVPFWVGNGLEAVGHQWLLQGNPVEELHLLKHPVHNTDMEVHMPVQARAEPVNEADCADVQGRLVRICRTGAVVLQALRYDPQENAQHHVEHCPVTLHEVAQPLTPLAQPYCP